MIQALAVRWLRRAAFAALPAGFLMASVLVLAGGSTTATASGCGVSVDPTGAVSGLTEPDQAQNAKTIIETGLALTPPMPARGLVVAIATAMQESTLHNLDGGDRDSVGLFQQRAPWGSFEERTDPATAATMFFTGGRGGQPGLLDIDGWQDMPVTQAAQAVQVSGFPGAYAKWETLASSIVAEVTAGTDITCPDKGTAGSCRATTDLSGFRNGEIPEAALCALTFDPDQHLRADAAAAADQLDAAYEAQWGTKLCVTDSYRSYADQVRLKAEKGYLAAEPGTSNHGWGQALDLCGGIQTPGSSQHRWMAANAGTYGWHNPEWAVPGGSGPFEPWHWEYGT